jgi:hypothetical protein
MRAELCLLCVRESTWDGATSETGATVSGFDVSVSDLSERDPG